MSKYVIIWTVGGLIFGVILGAIIGITVGEGTLPGWVVVSGIGGTLFFGLWGYANEPHRKVRHADDKPKKSKAGS